MSSKDVKELMIDPNMEKFESVTQELYDRGDESRREGSEGAILS